MMSLMDETLKEIAEMFPVRERQGTHRDVHYFIRERTLQRTTPKTNRWMLGSSHAYFEYQDTVEDRQAVIGMDRWITYHGIGPENEARSIPFKLCVGIDAGETNQYRDIIEDDIRATIDTFFQHKELEAKKKTGLESIKNGTSTKTKKELFAECVGIIKYESLANYRNRVIEKTKEKQ